MLALCPHCGNPIDITISVSIQQAPDAAGFADIFPAKQDSVQMPMKQKQLIERLQAVIPEREYWLVSDLNHRMSRYGKARAVRAALKILEKNGQVEIESLGGREIVRWRPFGAPMSEAQKASLLERARRLVDIMGDIEAEGGDIEEKDVDEEASWLKAFQAESESEAESEAGSEAEKSTSFSPSSAEATGLMFNAFDIIAKEAESSPDWADEE